MLTFDVKARPRFADLLVDFKRMSEEMVKDLEVKYGV